MVKLSSWVMQEVEGREEGWSQWSQCKENNLDDNIFNKSIFFLSHFLNSLLVSKNQPYNLTVSLLLGYN